MQQEIAALERETGQHSTPEEEFTRSERYCLASLVDRYGDEHPDAAMSDHARSFPPSNRNCSVSWGLDPGRHDTLQSFQRGNDLA